MQLTEHPFFASSFHTQFKGLLEAVKVAEYKPQQCFFKCGDACDSLFIILQGTVALIPLQQGDEKEEEESRRASEGSLLGAVELLTEKPYNATAIATTAVTVARIPRRHLLHYIQNHDLLSRHIIENLTAAVCHSQEKLTHHARMAKIGHILNTILHDFKNPLAAVSLGIQLLMREHKNSNSQKVLKNMIGQVRHMVSMTEEIREFSRGRHEFQFLRFDLRKWFGRFRQLNATLFQDEDIQICFEVEAVTFEADPTKLLRMLQNLVINACESIDKKKGKESITIKAHTTPNKEWVLITVQDNGEGISQEIQYKVFEPFITKDRGYRSRIKRLSRLS